MSDAFYTIDNSKHLPVKIVRLPREKWRVFHLKRIIQVLVLFADPRLPSEIRFKVEWEREQLELIWNRKLDRYCDYFTYPPFDEKDISAKFTFEMVKYTKTWHSHLVQWRVPSTVRDCELVSVNGFSLRNYRLGIVCKDSSLAGFERLGVFGEKGVEASVNGRLFARNSVGQVFEFRSGVWQNIGCCAELDEFARKYCEAYPSFFGVSLHQPTKPFILKRLN
jgi:hypothetical protein